MPKNPSSKPNNRPSSHHAKQNDPVVLAFIATLKTDFPQFTFRESTRFAFRPPKTIFLGPTQPNYTLLTLHELSHALLKHKHDNTHISRLKHEAEAWEHAKQLAIHYSIPWGPKEEDFAQDQLDSYRHHLHQKSLCPTCQTSRYEDKSGSLHCPFCAG